MIHYAEISKIYHKHSDSLYAYAKHLGFNDDTVMDAMHDVFYKLCINDETLKNITNIKFYLFRALKNRLIDIHRTNREYSGNLLNETKSQDKLPFNLNVSVEDELIEKEDLEEIQRKVKNILAQLTDRQREIVYFRYIHEYDYAKIAELMNITVESCQNLISKSITKLKKSSLDTDIILLIISTLYIYG